MTESFKWWTGVVEDRDDPEQLGRCRVRIFGYHSEDITLLPTSKLPWAIPLQPTTSAATSGIGSTPVGIVPGTWVAGWFLDGEEAQRPIIFGTIAGKPTYPSAVDKTKEQDTVNTTTGSVRASDGNTVYSQSGNPVAAAYTKANEKDSLKPLNEQKLTIVLDAVAKSLSNNDYSKVGTNGELGKYQLSPVTLINLGYVKRPPNGILDDTTLDDPDNWVGRKGIRSKQSFLSNTSAQEEIVFEYWQDNYNTLLRLGKISETDDYKVVAGLLTVSHVYDPENADKLDKKNSEGARAREYFTLGNSALGGDADQFIKRYEETGNFLPKVQTADFAGAVNTEDLKKLTGFQDPNKKYPKYEYYGLSDINKLAISDKTHLSFKIKDNNRVTKIPLARTSQTWDEPITAFGGVYPYNQVIETEGGHVIELDSTPNAERIQVFHKSGTHIEIDVNGSMVRKTVGENYEIMDRNNFVYVKGAHNLTVEGKTNILVKDNASIEVEGDLSVTGHGDTTVQTAGVAGIVAETALISAQKGFDVVTEGTINLQGKDINLYAKGGSITQKASGDISLETGSFKNLSLKGGLSVLIDAVVVKTKSGANSIREIALGVLSPPSKKTPDTTGIPVLTRPSFNDAAFQYDALETGSTDYAKSQAAAGAISSKISPTPSGALTPEQQSSQPITPCDCTEFEGIEYFPRSLVLSKYFKLDNFIRSEKGPRLQAQRGLREKDIVCNLKQLAVNCLDPIKAKYPNMNINSGFRIGELPSDHNIGAAADLSFPGTSFSKYKEIADWIIANVPYRQVLLEYQFDKSSYKLSTAWIHVAYLAKDNNLIKSSSPTFTVVNHAKYSNGFTNLA